MLSTDKLSCNILADLLVAHGVNHVVLSPGSRNTPLIVALSRRNELETHIVVDERSAAFIALGMSIQLGKPVAIVCTSGTALLNYAPAVAEAFYRGCPLIVISADRPEEWIDQDDSQTIWQQNALSPYVKRSCDIPAHTNFANAEWVCNRLINDLLLEAATGRKGPVHINVRLDAPLNKIQKFTPDRSRVISMVSPSVELPTDKTEELKSRISSPRKVLIIVGFHEPDSDLRDALERLARQPNIAVMTETIANVSSPLFINKIDSTLCRISTPERSKLAPDIVITAGGALVSRFVKEWVRSLNNVEHWHVGLSHTTIDCFKHLALRIEIKPSVFFKQLSAEMQPTTSPDGYSQSWRKQVEQAETYHKQYIDSSPWSDMIAFSHIIPNIPSTWNLHLSNGTPIRYAQLMDSSHINRCDCNRGVSGIDGCTSTAVGASVASPETTTLLITGDMSCQYDLGALASTLITPKFKIIVMCNGGGGIFRFISSTSTLPEMEKYFAVGTRLPLRQLADGFGFSYHEAHDLDELRSAFKSFATTDDRPAILAVFTPPTVSAEVLRQYFQQP